LKFIGFIVLIAGLVLTVRNFRDRSRVRILQAKLTSREFFFLAVAVALTAVTFIPLAYNPVRHGPQSMVVIATYGGDPDSFTMPFHLDRPNLFPGGRPQETIGDVFQIASLLFILLPTGLISLPLLMKRSRFRGVAEGVLATALGALCTLVDFSTGLIVFVPTAAAMLSAAAFARS